jgi:hypothetical protein
MWSSYTVASSFGRFNLQCLFKQLHVAQPGRFTEPSYTAACTVALGGWIYGIQLNGCIEHCQIRCTVPSTAACSTA